MKKIFLASSIDRTGKAIAKEIGEDTSKLRTAFITTAAEVEDQNDLEWLEEDRNGLASAGFDLFDYTITNKTPEQIKKDLGEVDVIHVNGGNTFYLLLQARKSGFDKFIKKFVESGGIYIGSSAGSIVASPDITLARKIESKIYEKELKDFKGFKLVNFIVFPHWGSNYFKELYLNHRMDIAYVTGHKIILLTDTQYVKVEDDMFNIVDIND